MELNQIKQKLIENYDLVFSSLGISYESFNENIYSICPIHNNSDNPRAFSFSPKRGLWKCWTRNCQDEYKNDIFGLIQAVLSKQNGLTNFAQALKWSKDLLGITQAYTSKKTYKIINPYEDLDNIINIFRTQSNDQDHNTYLKYTPQRPSEYFLNRGFKAETLEYFDVGDCDEIKDRSIIPIHDDTGQNIIGTICRATKEYKLPKFLIYPKGFKKYSLYNYHRAINKAKEKSCLFLVEGQGDVWKLYESGVHNVVGILGKTITKEQEEKIYGMPVTHLIILTDNDQAGRESKVEIKRKLGRMYKLSFPQLYGKDVGDMSVEKIKSNILSKLEGTY